MGECREGMDGIWGGERWGAQQGKDAGTSMLSPSCYIRSHLGLSAFAPTRLPRYTGLAQAHRARQGSPGSPTMPSIWNIVKARLEYFANRASNTGKTQAEIETELKNLLVRQLGSISKIDFDTAAGISNMLKEAAFLSEPTRAMIGDLVHSTIEHGMHVESELNGTKCKFRAIENYQSQRCWDNSSYTAWPGKWQA